MQKLIVKKIGCWPVNHLLKWELNTLKEVNTLFRNVQAVVLFSGVIEAVVYFGLLSQRICSYPQAQHLP